MNNMDIPIPHNEFETRFGNDPKLNHFVQQIIAIDLPFKTDTAIGHVTFHDFITSALLGNLEVLEIELNNPLQAGRRATIIRGLLEREITARKEQQQTKPGQEQLEYKLALVQDLYHYINTKTEMQPGYETTQIKALKTAVHYYLFPQLALDILNYSKLNSLVQQIIAIDPPITDTEDGHITFKDFITSALFGNLGVPEIKLNDPKREDLRANTTRRLLVGEITARKEQQKNKPGQEQLKCKLALVQDLYRYLNTKERMQPSYETTALKTAAHYYLFPQLALNILNETGGRYGTEPDSNGNPEEGTDSDNNIY